MKIIVDSQQTKIILMDVCRSALATQNLNIAKMAVVASENIIVKESKHEPPIENKDALDKKEKPIKETSNKEKEDGTKS